MTIMPCIRNTLQRIPNRFWSSYYFFAVPVILTIRATRVIPFSHYLQIEISNIVSFLYIFSYKDFKQIQLNFLRYIQQLLYYTSGMLLHRCPTLVSSPENSFALQYRCCRVLSGYSHIPQPSRMHTYPNERKVKRTKSGTNRFYEHIDDPKAASISG